MTYITATFELHVDGDITALHTARVECPPTPWPASLAHELKRRCSPNVIAAALTAALANGADKQGDEPQLAGANDATADPES